MTSSAGAKNDEERALRCHELLKDLTAEDGVGWASLMATTAEPFPTPVSFLTGEHPDR
jgi:hypothetical protein